MRQEGPAQHIPATLQYRLILSEGAGEGKVGNSLTIVDKKVEELVWLLLMSFTALLSVLSIS